MGDTVTASPFSLPLSFLNGVKTGLRTTLSLAKVVFPVCAVVSMLEKTVVMEWITGILTPVMGIVGLPGHAAIPMAIGLTLNIYGAIASALTLDFTVKEVMLIAVFLGFSHNLFVETAITTRIGVKPYFSVGIRLAMSVGTVAAINGLWQGGGEAAVYLIRVQETAVVYTNALQIIGHGLYSAAISIFQIVCFVVPIMILIQILKDLDILARFAHAIYKLTRFLGVSPATSVPLLAGITFGITYGAGLILSEYDQGAMTSKDIYLITVFLVGCHAAIEDTLIYIALGFNVVYLLLIRLAIACFATVLTSKIWEKALKTKKG